jgi:hypothetical protein
MTALCSSVSSGGRGADGWADTDGCCVLELRMLVIILQKVPKDKKCRKIKSAKTPSMRLLVVAALCSATLRRDRGMLDEGERAMRRSFRI